MKKLEQWYDNTNKKQKIFVYLISIPLMPLFVGFGLLAILIYLELGKRG